MLHKHLRRYKLNFLYTHTVFGSTCRSGFSTTSLFFINVPASDITTKKNLSVRDVIRSCCVVPGIERAVLFVIVFQLFKLASRMPPKSKKRKHIGEPSASERS